MSSEAQTAVIVGVGPGLGTALARRLAEEEMKLALVARSKDRISKLAEELDFIASEATAYVADATKESDVRNLFEAVSEDLGLPDLVIFNAGASQRRSILEVGTSDLEDQWRQNCLGGFLVGREALRMMVPRGEGTLLFSGSTGSVSAAAGFAGFSVGKFGLRALAQSMAREVGPLGVHVGHIVIDGEILSERNRQALVDRSPDEFLTPEATAEAFLQLHRQKRSAWSFEMDLRPWKERF
ncbi:MAG: SDR family NAD(P)-dependent oxidoreductase [Deltaproteobacteria bacterium]|nr:SDR family NAD(P)-dependent oxidoreductase [Deltaproteobacteria bacterium]